jgi:uncharacterized protein (DUF1800 family)
MSVSFVHVWRLRDKLILVSTTDDETVIANIKKEEEKLTKQISQKSATQLSFPGQFADFHVCISGGIFTVSATTSDFDAALAYQLNDEVNHAVLSEYGESLDAVESKYAFFEFSTTLDSIRKRYVNKVKNANLSQLQREIGEVEDSMAANLRSAIARDDKINEVGRMSEEISNKSGIFASKATNLNRLHIWRTYGRPATVLSIITVVYCFVHFIL